MHVLYGTKNAIFDTLSIAICNTPVPSEIMSGCSLQQLKWYDCTVQMFVLPSKKGSLSLYFLPKVILFYPEFS